MKKLRFYLMLFLLFKQLFSQHRELKIETLTIKFSTKNDRR
jgi:hypothetical protein